VDLPQPTADHGEHLIAPDVETHILDGVLVAGSGVHGARRHHGVAHHVANGNDGVGLGKRGRASFFSVSRNAR